MKKVSLFILVLITNLMFGQGTASIPTQESFLEKVFIDGVQNSFKYSEITGSAYENAEFAPLNASSDFEQIDARYNSYADQVEFAKNNQIFILPKNEKFSRLKFENSNTYLVLLNLNGVEGYCYELYSKDNKSLLKKVKTTLDIPAKSKNSYASDDSTPAFTTKVIYYIMIGEKVIEVPAKRRKLLDLLPAEKNVLEKKIKSEGIDINSEKGLITLVKIL